MARLTFRSGKSLNKSSGQKKIDFFFGRQSESQQQANKMSDEYDCVLNGCGENVPCAEDCKCECTHCQRNRPTHEEDSEDEKDECCECIYHGDDGCKCDCHSEEDEDDMFECPECKMVLVGEAANDERVWIECTDGDGYDVCIRCEDKCIQREEAKDMKSHPCECGVKECSDCFPEEDEESK